MRKTYPYLQDSYYEDANSQRQRRNFLATIDNFVNQKQYVKITLLNWEEEPIKEIAGELTSGTISKDGSSSVRRTCQIGVTVSRGEYTVEDTELDFSINKKMFVEIGIKNYSDQYKDYPILWFPQGVFFISSFAVTSSSSSNINISLTLKDKMCGLNGEVGGTFQSTTILDSVYTQTPSGEATTKKVLIYDLITELVNHFGGENLNNILIEDVSLRIKRIMKWTGDVPLYMTQQNAATEGYNWMCYAGWGNIPEDMQEQYTWNQYNNGDDVGYIYDDFYYTSELSMNAGETVTAALDKIVQYLGNYEYFYDEFGVFHFREIKNYLNTTQATILLNDMNANDYLVDVATDKDIYTFSDNANLVSISANPRYENIKNDYIIHGLRKMTSSDISYDVFYHLAIDNKPQPLGQDGGENYYNTYYDLLLYKDEDTKLIQAVFPVSTSKLPEVGNFNIVYRIPDTSNEELEGAKKDYQQQIEDITNNILPELHTKLTGLNNQLTELNAKIASYTLVTDKTQEQIKNLTGYKEDLQKQLDSNRLQYNADIIELTRKQSDLETYRQRKTVLDLQLKIDPTNQSDREELDVVKARIKVLEDDIKNLEPNILSLKSQIDTDKNLIEDYNKRIEECQKSIAEAGTIPEYVDLIKQRMELKENIKKTQQTISRNELEINNLDNKIDQANDKIKENNNNYVNTSGYSFVYWDNDVYKPLQIIKYYPTKVSSESSGYRVRDWRTEIYLQGLLAKNNGTDAGMYYHNLKLNYTQAATDVSWIGDVFRYVQKNRVDTDYYFQELEAFWPQIYNLETQKFYGEEEKSQLWSTSLAEGNYYLDFIEPQTSKLGEFSIQNIGRRMDVVNDEDVNCLFQPAIPNVIFLNSDDEDNFSQQKDECIEKGESWTQVNGDIYWALATGGYKKAAYDQIKYELYLHTNYQKTLSLTALPVYYLEPNSRITINDKSTNTYGSFVLNSVSIPLGTGNVMSGSCSECFERF